MLKFESYHFGVQCMGKQGAEQLREAGFILVTVSGLHGREGVTEQSCSPQGTQEAENGGGRGSQDTPRNTPAHTSSSRPHLNFQNLLREHHQLETKPSVVGDAS